MAEKNCKACTDLQDDYPTFVNQGVTDEICTNLKNDAGFKTGDGVNDCTDLTTANDCLIGNLEEDLKIADDCDWKAFMEILTGNLYNMLKALICAICGIWTNVHNLWTKVNELEDELDSVKGRLATVENKIVTIENNQSAWRQEMQKMECSLDALFKGQSLNFDESSDTASYIVAGKGVSFLSRSAGGGSADVKLLYIAGGLGRLNGSLIFSTESFTESASVYNWDLCNQNPETPRKTAARRGNGAWNDKGAIVTELAYEIRLSLDEYPQIDRLYSGLGHEVSAYGFHCESRVFNPGSWAWGQHGTCDAETGDQSEIDYDPGHRVPDNYIYIQLRMTYIDDLITVPATEAGATPRAWLGVRLNKENIDCD